jgi:indole-3-glycerol phosphate synthase
MFVEALLAARTPVIAEVKRSDANGAGLLGDRSVAEIVDTYQEAGMPCLSVVTGRWFGGTVDMLAEVTARTSLPVLQKDFITRDSQLVRARDMGASAVLLTARLLPAETLRNLIVRTLRLELTPFVEVVDEAEIEAVVHGDECVIAVNNKDITTGERDSGDPDRGVDLLPAVLGTGTSAPVSASGIEHPWVGASLVAQGFSGLLVGTGLLRAASPQCWIDELHRYLEAKEIP